MTKEKLILKTVSDVISKAGTRDPFIIANYLGINIQYSNMPADVPGFLTEFCGKYEICISRYLSESFAKIVCAHEIGHFLCKSKKIEGVFKKNCPSEFLNETEWRLESSSNQIAAEILLSDDDVLDILLQEVDFFTAAKMLSVPSPLLSIKLKLMESKGVRFPSFPTDFPPDCLMNPMYCELKSVDAPQS